MGKLIFMWSLVSPCHLPGQEHWEPLDLSDSDDINEVVNTELLSLLNPWSGDDKGSWGGSSPWSLLHQLQFQPPSNNLWSELASLGCPFRENLPQSNLNGCGVNRFTHGCPAPLTFIWHSVMAQGISCQPSWIVKGLQQDRLVYQPKCLPLWVQMQYP